MKIFNTSLNKTLPFYAIALLMGACANLAIGSEYTLISSDWKNGNSLLDLTISHPDILTLFVFAVPDSDISPGTHSLSVTNVDHTLTGFNTFNLTSSDIQLGKKLAATSVYSGNIDPIYEPVLGYQFPPGKGAYYYYLDANNTYTSFADSNYLQLDYLYYSTDAKYQVPGFLGPFYYDNNPSNTLYEEPYYGGDRTSYKYVGNMFLYLHGNHLPKDTHAPNNVNTPGCPEGTPGGESGGGTAGPSAGGGGSGGGNKGNGGAGNSAPGTSGGGADSGNSGDGGKNGNAKTPPGQGSTCAYIPIDHTPAYAGMAGASLNRFQAGVSIIDCPIWYTPAVGSDMSFYLYYNQRQVDGYSALNYYSQSDFISSNFGHKWSCNWISYIIGGPASGFTSATLVAPNGNNYTWDNYVEIPPPVFNNWGHQSAQGDFIGNEAWTHGTLHYRQNPERYERWMPDGTIEKYALAIGAPAGSLPDGTVANVREYFLTSIIDPQGNVTTLSYNPLMVPSNKAVLDSVADPKGGKLLFSYDDLQDPLHITKVTRSCDGHFAKFGYTNGQLTSSTDPSGITSSFVYTLPDPNPPVGTASVNTYFINSMTTPYGTTHFHSSDGLGYQEVDMTNPLGQNQRVEYQSNLDTSLVPASEANAPAASGLVIDNSNLNKNNSFYWNRRAISEATATGAAVDSAAFYALAEVTHWSQSDAGTLPLALSEKSPLTARVWYTYPHQPSPDFVDTSAPQAQTLPNMVARFLDDETTQISQATYADATGFVTQSIDPMGRTTNYNYDTNGIDLLQVTHVNGGGLDVLSSATYNGQHLPLTVTDASQQVTHFTYNGLGQLLTTTNAKAEMSTLTYYPNGLLESASGPVSGTTVNFTWNNSLLLHTITDSDGYCVTQFYDALDRETETLFPDGSSSWNYYDKLHLVQQTDRQNRSTWNEYDAIGELTKTTSTQGSIQKYSWCTCGGLSTLTDANNHVTTWSRDILGRVTAKLYDNQSQSTCTYEDDTGLPSLTTDARGNTSTLSYYLDGSLAGVIYNDVAGSTVTTPNVNFTYDNVYGRLLTRTDATGTTYYTYNPTTGSLTTGAGELANVIIPIGGSTATVAYTYDELGRGTGRTIDGTNNASSAIYDNLGRVTDTTNPLGHFIYAYVNQTDRIDTVTNPNWQKTKFSYLDNLHDKRLSEIRNYVAGVLADTPLSDFQYSYNAEGTIATWQQQVGSNAATTYNLGYDLDDQLTSAIQNDASNVQLTSNKYGYDPAGNRLSEITLSGTSVGGFDNLNQLTSFTSSAATQTVSGYTTAPVSSVTVNAVPASVSNGTNFTASVAMPAGTNTVSVVANPTSGPVITQRYQTVATGTSPTSLGYNSNGDTTTDEEGNSYDWDALSRLRKITYPGGATSIFTYDGMSHRVEAVEKDASGTVQSHKFYLWIGSNIAEERDSSNSVTKRFYSQGEIQGTTPYYYTGDHLGSVRELVDSSGNVAARYAYDLYGRTTKLTGSVDSTYRYASMEWHQSSLSYETRFRFYHPSTERWLSRDPMEEDGGVNLYGYVENNPASFVDPDGCSLKDALNGFNNAEINGLIDTENDAKYANYSTWSLPDIPQLPGSDPELNDCDYRKGYAAGELAFTVASMLIPGPKANCFPKGSLVSTPTGLHKIEDIQNGDIVYAYDVKHQEVKKEKVVDIYVNTTNEWEEIAFERGETLQCTPGHQIWVDSEHRWKLAADLKSGMALLLKNGERRNISKITIISLRKPEITYNIEVEHEHNYFIGTSQILVHNLSGVRGTYTHYFQTGMKYFGKGPIERALRSGILVAKKFKDTLIGTDFTPATSGRNALKEESRRIVEDGGPGSPGGVPKPGSGNYNRIHSPGRKIP